MRSPNQKGFSIVAALVSLVIVGIAAVGVSRLFSQYSRGAARADKSARGDQVLVRTAARIQMLDYDFLLRLCRSKKAMAGPVTGKCTAADDINASLTFDPASTDDSSLEVPRNFEGAPLLGGAVCVELGQCALRAGGLLLELTLHGYWHDPKLGLQSRFYNLRRTRW